MARKMPPFMGKETPAEERKEMKIKKMSPAMYKMGEKAEGVHGKKGKMKFEEAATFLKVADSTRTLTNERVIPYCKSRLTSSSRRSTTMGSNGKAPLSLPLAWLRLLPPPLPLPLLPPLHVGLRICL